MKRICFISFFILVISTIIFAQEAEKSGLKVQGGVDFALVPLQFVTQDSKENNVWIGSGLGSGLQGFRTRLGMSGNYEDKAGFRADLWFYRTNEADANPSSLNLRLGDYATVWWSPFTWLRFDVGRLYDPQLSGKIGDLGYAPYTIGMGSHYEVFSYYSSATGGALVSFKPIKNLFIGYFVPNFGMPFIANDPSDQNWFSTNLLTPGADSLNNENDPSSNSSRAFRIFQRSWVSLGYLFEDIGHARVQFVGANPNGSVNWTIPGEGGNPSTARNPYDLRVISSAPRFEGAFALTRFDNLIIDFGFKVWVPISDWITDNWNDSAKAYTRAVNTGTYWGGLQFALRAFYNGFLDEKLSLIFYGDAHLLRTWTGIYTGENTRVTNPFRLNFHLASFYDLDFAVIGVNAGVEYFSRNDVSRGGKNLNTEGEFEKFWLVSDRFRFGAGVWIEKRLGSISIEGGVAYRNGTNEDHGDEKRAISIPIMFYYRF